MNEDQVHQARCDKERFFLVMETTAERSKHLWSVREKLREHCMAHWDVIGFSRPATLEQVYRPRILRTTARSEKRIVLPRGEPLLIRLKTTPSSTASFIFMEFTKRSSLSAPVRTTIAEKLTSSAFFIIMFFSD